MSEAEGHELRHCGVLQIEPTDFCNLTCPMCHPQQGFRPNLHGDLLKGYMDMGLYRRIIDGIARGRARFDHLIFQWLGDPSLHPELFDMLDYALEKVADRFEYFRIDTNAILFGPERVQQLLAAYQRRPDKPVLIVFSLDSISRDVYRRVKGRDCFDQVMANVHNFLEQRGKLELDSINLNAEFQFVLQEGNHHEVGDFVRYWDEACAQGRNGVGYNDVMIKRISVGTGGEKQHQADRLYARAIREHGLAPFDKDHLHLKIWMERAWEEHDDPEAGDADLALGETGMAAPSLVT